MTKYNTTTIDHNIQVKLNITTDQYVFLDCIYNYNHKKKITISFSDINTATGFSIDLALAIWRSLKESGLVTANGSQIQTTDLWNMHFQQKDSFIVNVINFMNNVLNTSYKSNSKAAVKFITARQNEGHTFEDFTLVIHSRAKEWSHDDNMRQYLRPETIFGTKFESYLMFAKANQPKEIINPRMEGMKM